MRIQQPACRCARQVVTHGVCMQGCLSHLPRTVRISVRVTARVYALQRHAFYIRAHRVLCVTPLILTTYTSRVRERLAIQGGRLIVRDDLP